MATSFPGFNYVRRFFRDIGGKVRTPDEYPLLPERVYDRLATTVVAGNIGSTNVSAITGLTIQVPEDEDWLLEAVSCYSVTANIDVADAASFIQMWLSPRDSDGRLVALLASTQEIQIRDTVAAQNREIFARAGRTYMAEHGDRIIMYIAAGLVNITAVGEFLGYRYPRGMAPWSR